MSVCWVNKTRTIEIEILGLIRRNEVVDEVTNVNQKLVCDSGSSVQVTLVSDVVDLRVWSIEQRHTHEGSLWED